MAVSAPQVAIAGLGLIGGSLGMALRARGWDVSFLDPAVTAEEAALAGAAHRRLETLEACRFVVLATPVDSALRLLDAIDPGETVVTSVCSVMAPLSQRAAARGIRFVAGHPLAGSEARTLAAASPDLFRGRRWFLGSHAEEALVDRVVSDAGAETVHVDPEEHDRAVAWTSHVPQILSTALASAIARSGVDAEAWGGAGLRTFLRLAGSSGEVWEPVVTANRENIRAASAETLRAVERIIDGNGSDDFARAAELWGRLQPRR